MVGKAMARPVGMITPGRFRTASTWNHNRYRKLLMMITSVLRCPRGNA